MKTVVVVGAGDRANVYASYALSNPDKMKIVGVVEPDEVRRWAMRDKYSIAEENCFTSVDEFVKKEKLADAVINGTMDQYHVETSIPILKKGYDMLLEKPFAVNKDEMAELLEVVEKTGRKVYICHVLRYTPFYASIKNHVANGDIGDIISIQLDEHVSYHHMVASYVRGKWRSEKTCFAPMLLAKSCHDVDLMMWMLGDTAPVSVASFGSDFQFSPKNKPENAGTWCMKDCPLKDTCIHDAELTYVTNRRWEQYVCAEGLEGKGEITDEMLKESLLTDNLYGKCVWDFERDGNVDHQSVIVNFENGATGTFNMVGGTACAERNIHIIGTKGEIKGVFEKQKYVVRTIDPHHPWGFTEKEYDTEVTGDMSGEHGGHGGGDGRLVADFIEALETGKKSISCTDIKDSTKSHLTVFKAEESRKTGKTVEL